MGTLELTHLVVHVEFNPGAIGSSSIPLFTFSGSGIILPAKEIEIPQGIAMIVIDLTTKPGFGGDEAKFQTSPVQWFAPPSFNPIPILPSTIPVDKPEMFVVQRLGPNNLTILDFNSDPVSTKYDFNLVVVYKGNTYGSDPAIINEPPVSGSDKR